MVVDRCNCDLATVGGLNYLHDGGRVPPQGPGYQPQALSGLSVPRHHRRARALDANESSWHVGGQTAFRLCD